jgi:hypothetical protein
VSVFPSPSSPSCASFPSWLGIRTATVSAAHFAHACEFYIIIEVVGAAAVVAVRAGGLVWLLALKLKRLTPADLACKVARNQ